MFTLEILDVFHPFKLDSRSIVTSHDLDMNLFSIKFYKMLTCVLRTQDNDLKIEFKNKCCIEKILSF